MTNSQHSSSSHKATLLRVCRIGRAQGLRGEVNVLSYTDSPHLRFAPGSTLQTKDGTVFIVRKSRQFKLRWIVHFEGIDDRTAAEALKGKELFIQKSSDLSSVSKNTSSNNSSDTSSNNSSINNSRSASSQSAHPLTNISSPATSSSSPTSSSAPSFISSSSTSSSFTNFQSTNSQPTGSQTTDSPSVDSSLETIINDELDPDTSEYYFDDLVGLKAYDSQGIFLGEIINIMDRPPQPLLEIKEPQGNISLIPFVEEIVPSVDLENSSLEINPPGGLLVEYSPLSSTASHPQKDHPCA